MALTHTTAVRNAATDAVVDLIDVGTTDANGDIEIATSSAFTTILGTIEVTATAFGASSAGTATLTTLPVSVAAAAASGTATFFRFKDRDNTEIFRGTVTATGGGGDMELVSPIITAGEPVEITGCTYTALPA